MQSLLDPSRLNEDALDEETLDRLRDLSKKDLYIFGKGILGFDWLIPHIHLPLCRLLELYDGYTEGSLLHPWEDYEKVLRSKYLFGRDDIDMSEEDIKKEILRIKKKGIKRLRITLPRGWLKTTLCSQAYPMWRAIRTSGFS